MKYLQLIHVYLPVHAAKPTAKNTNDRQQKLVIMIMASFLTSQPNVHNKNILDKQRQKVCEY